MDGTADGGAVPALEPWGQVEITGPLLEPGIGFGGRICTGAVHPVGGVSGGIRLIAGRVGGALGSERGGGHGGGP